MPVAITYLYKKLSNIYKNLSMGVEFNTSTEFTPKWDYVLDGMKLGSAQDT
jgi:hypothetical protein